jgi:hypothetical protein
VQHPGPDREFAVWSKEKKIKWIGVDCGSADHWRRRRRCPRRGLGMRTTLITWRGFREVDEAVLGVKHPSWKLESFQDGCFEHALRPTFAVYSSIRSTNSDRSS